MTLNKNYQRFLNSPEVKVAQETIESVKLIEWAISRLLGLTNKQELGHTDLQSCMTLDVEHFHAITFYKTPVMTMFQYCRRLSCQGQ